VESTSRSAPSLSCRTPPLQAIRVVAEALPCPAGEYSRVGLASGSPLMVPARRHPQMYGTAAGWSCPTRRGEAGSFVVLRRLDQSVLFFGAGLLTHLFF